MVKSTVSKYVWDFETKFCGPDWVYSDLFNINSDVTFNIAVRRNFEGNIDVRFRKSNIKSAQTNIKVEIKDLKGEQDLEWEDTCVFEHFIRCPEEFIYRDSSGEEYFAIKIFSTIIWRGFEAEMPKLDFFSNLDKDFFFSQVFSDALVVVDGLEIPVHKVILSTFSPVFLKLFPSNEHSLPGETNRVEITDFSSDIVLEMLKFFYSGKTEASDDLDTALNMYQIALKYQVTDLIRICKETIAAHLNLDNFARIIKSFDNNSDFEGNFREEIIKFLSDNVDRLFNFSSRDLISKPEFRYALTSVLLLKIF